MSDFHAEALNAAREQKDFKVVVVFANIIVIF